MCMKEVREEILFKDNYIRELKIKDAKEKDEKKSHHNHNNDVSSTKTVPLKIDMQDISNAISRAASDRNLVSGANQIITPQGYPIIVLKNIPSL